MIVPICVFDGCFVVAMCVCVCVCVFRVFVVYEIWISIDLIFIYTLLLFDALVKQTLNTQQQHNKQQSM